MTHWRASSWNNWRTVPAEGEMFQWTGYRFEVIDMDRHRVDKVLVYPPGAAEPQKKAVV